MPAPVADTVVLGALNPIEGKVVSVPSHQTINEKTCNAVDDAEIRKDGALVLKPEIKAAPLLDDGDDHDKDNGSEDVIIITGADAAEHLLPLRDDGDPALTFRSLFLASGLSAFQAVMSQIYNVS
jgi:hypothetical protein